MTKTNTNRKGFTIIEVVLVLAIAGLIFLMVFIALPALQRSQRNTRRRSDMARIMSAITDYQAAVGHVPNSYDDRTGQRNPKELMNLVDKYIVGSSVATLSSSKRITTSKCEEQFCDPDGSPYEFETRHKFTTYETMTDGSTIDDYITQEHAIYYYMHAKCGGDRGITPGNGDNEVAIFYKLEGGAVYCADNS